MKENSIKIIEEKIKALDLHIQNYETADCKTSVYDVLQEERNALVDILQDYKRVLKENEELIQEKINIFGMIARNKVLGYAQGYEDGKNSRKSAVAIMVENQQYYIIKKQIEKYEEHIKRLQEKNKQLENEVMEKNLEIIGKEEYIKASIKDIFDVKMHNFNYLSETDWSETQRIIDKEVANILQQILQELLESGGNK